MIVNTSSVILLFQDLVCLVLALFLVAFAVRQLRRAEEAGHIEKREGYEQGITLALLVTLIVMGLRLLSWPLLYATLHSFITSIDGAMCLYGVTRQVSTLARVAELAKPVVVFLAGAWFLVNRLDLRSETSPLARTKTKLLLMAALAMLVEIPLELALVLGIRPTFVVTCCTTVADVAERPSSMIPLRVLGEDYGPALSGAFFGALGLLLLLCFVAAFLRKGGLSWLLSLLALLLLPVAWLFTLEVLAPAWMGLPYHHCWYCFLTYRDAPLAIAAFVLGVLALWWASVLRRLAKGEELAGPGHEMIRRCHGGALFLLAAASGMALIHLWKG